MRVVPTWGEPGTATKLAHGDDVIMELAGEIRPVEMIGATPSAIAKAERRSPNG